MRASRLRVTSVALTLLFAGAAGAGENEHLDVPPAFDPLVRPAPYERDRFGPDPDYANPPYDAAAQIEIYGGKSEILGTPRPLVELGREMYQGGPVGDGNPILGEKNRVLPQLLVYGDYRMAVAYNDSGGDDLGLLAARLNLDVDLRLTATERIHAFLRPIDEGGEFSRYEFSGSARDRNANPEFEFREEPNFLFFEGDLGYLVAGFADTYPAWDLPFAFGKIPLFFQNGVWFEDAIFGGAFSIPAKNSRVLDISNFDITFFGGVGEITTDAFVNRLGKRAIDEAKLVGFATFFDVWEGYVEAGYALLLDEDSSDGDFTYHNATVALTKRYRNLFSSSVRLIGNFGQDPGKDRAKTADGGLAILETSLITHLPLTLVPYANFFVGLDSPQSVARAGDAGGVIKNVGLNFEDDALTGFPKLDPTARDAFGGAVGLEYLFSLEQQIVVEVAGLQPWNGREGPSKREQIAFGLRYQRPISRRWIVRVDGIYGYRAEIDDLLGARLELRMKF